MKIAEALIQRADYQKRIAQLQSRIVVNARVQEGEKAAEDPAELIKEVESIAAELLSLVQRINRTNSSTALDDDMSIADAIARRDSLRLRRAVYSAAAEAGVIRQDRYSKSEVRFESAVDVADAQNQADKLAQAYRELDTRIQEANWQTELVD